MGALSGDFTAVFLNRHRRPVPRRGTGPPPGRPESRGSVRGSLRNAAAGARAPGWPGARDRAVQESAVRAVRRRTPHAAPLRESCFPLRPRVFAARGLLYFSVWGRIRPDDSHAIALHAGNGGGPRGPDPRAARRGESAGGSSRGEKSRAARGRCRSAVRRNSVRRKRFRSGAVSGTARTGPFRGKMNSSGAGPGERGAEDHRREKSGPCPAERHPPDPLTRPGAAAAFSADPSGRGPVHRGSSDFMPHASRTRLGRARGKPRPHAGAEAFKNSCEGHRHGAGRPPAAVEAAFDQFFSRPT